MSDGKDEAPEYEVPPEQAARVPAPEPEPEAPRAAPSPTVSVSTSGVRAGDWVLGLTFAGDTDDTHDNPQNEERARAHEDDKHAAQHSLSGGAAPAWSTGPRPVTPRPRLDDALDAAREKARAEAAAREGVTTEVPILLHDPLTGEPIGTG